MGKKIPYDQAMQIGRLKTDGSIFTENNRYGYKININHPKIYPMYVRYHEKIGVPLHIHLTTAQRLAFESAVMKWFERKRNHVQQSDLDGQTDPRP